MSWTRTEALGCLRRATALVAVAAVGVTAAACGDSGSSTSSGSSSGKATADVAAAKEGIKPFSGHPSPFPVDQPLRKPLPKGKRFAYIQCAPPVCALYGQLLRGPIEALGGKLVVFKAGSSASGVQTAAASALATKPDALMLPAISASSLAKALDGFNQAKIPVVATSIPRGAEVGVDAQINGAEAFDEFGKVMADWVIAKKGASANTAFYTTPELDFTEPLQKAFAKEYNKLCPACKLHVLALPAATIGTTAPTRVVSDLQSHPDTNTAVFGSGEAATGLPAALKAAGISVTTIGLGPPPSFIEDVKEGKITAAFANDIPTLAWTQVDIAARLINKEPLLDSEIKGTSPYEFLESKDITFDASKGFSGYPDYAQRFRKLWHLDG